MPVNRRLPLIVSFDAEGTLATHDFSIAVWQEVVPALYAESRGMEVGDAKKVVFAEYMRVGMQRKEWFEIDYWFERFGLGPSAPIIEAHRHRIEFYPEVVPVLERLQAECRLVVASSTPYEFLEPLLRNVAGYFTRMFSATSEFGAVKDPSFFRWMCSELRVEPCDIVHVGDSWKKDYLGALEAGMVSYYLDRSDLASAHLHDLNGLVAALGDGAGPS